MGVSPSTARIAVAGEPLSTTSPGMGASASSPTVHSRLHVPALSWRRLVVATPRSVNSVSWSGAARAGVLLSNTASVNGATVGVAVASW